mmetsp:Transcript_17822/g.49357  ORF Transcript_17822/g.49357 Transcript_17822/m.49357 type:complete len:326 (+) Transcript_17822:1291-2268(+)
MGQGRLPPRGGAHALRPGGQERRGAGLPHHRVLARHAVRAALRRIRRGVPAPVGLPHVRRVRRRQLQLHRPDPPRGPVPLRLQLRGRRLRPGQARDVGRGGPARAGPGWGAAGPRRRRRHLLQERLPRGLPRRGGGPAGAGRHAGVRHLRLRQLRLPHRPVRAGADGVAAVGRQRQERAHRALLRPPHRHLQVVAAVPHGEGVGGLHVGPGLLRDPGQLRAARGLPGAGHGRARHTRVYGGAPPRALRLFRLHLPRRAAQGRRAGGQGPAAHRDGGRRGLPGGLLQPRHHLLQEQGAGGDARGPRGRALPRRLFRQRELLRHDPH